jgi:TfoX/Sxy family transcriptional regulator of competence genes
MFGNLAGFVNGNMFTGLFGSEVFVRLPEEARVRLLSEEGASPFEPMPGRPMTEYVVMPVAWRNEPEKAQTWVERSLNWAGGLPEKAAKPKK